MILTGSNGSRGLHETFEVVWKKVTTIVEQLQKLQKRELTEILGTLLTKFISPSFGALPKPKVAIEVLNALIRIVMKELC